MDFCTFRMENLAVTAPLEYTKTNPKAVYLEKKAVYEEKLADYNRLHEEDEKALIGYNSVVTENQRRTIHHYTEGN